MFVDLREPFCRLWRGKEVFREVFTLGGEEYRSVKNRRTFRIEIEGRGFFVKIHRGVGWREIWKNLLQFKLPVVSAWNEYRAIELLASNSIPTMTAAAFGCRGINPAALESFLITEELTGAVSLEDLAAGPLSVTQKRGLIRALGDSVGRMHRLGVNHRDCYLCHYLLRRETLDCPMPVLHVIDLHRAQIRERIPHRYQVKDVAGLYFSSLNVSLTNRDRLRFIKAYSGRDWREELADNGLFWRQVALTGERLYRKINRKQRECVYGKH